jgi:hypothetical protein
VLVLQVESHTSRVVFQTKNQRVVFAQRAAKPTKVVFGVFACPLWAFWVFCLVFQKTTKTKTSLFEFPALQGKNQSGVSMLLSLCPSSAQPAGFFETQTPFGAPRALWVGLGKTLIKV